MMGYLAAGACGFSEQLVAWQEECRDVFRDPTGVSSPFGAVFSETARGVLHEGVEGAFSGHSFDVEKYKNSVGEAANKLRSGIPPVVDGAVSEIVATMFNAAWEVFLAHPEKPILNFARIKKNNDELNKAMDAVHGLTLKGVEASFATRHWCKARSRRQRVRASVGGPSHGAILSRQEITARIDKGDLHFVPLLEPGQVSKSGVDLRLGTHFIMTKAGDVTHFSPMGIDKSRMHQLGQPVAKGLGYRFVIHPNRLVLGATLEYIALPADLGALVLSRSSYGRLGLLVATAIFVHPNWRGCLTLELANYSEVPIELMCGEPVAQLILFRADDVPVESLASPRSGLCPITPQFPEFATGESKKELRNLGRFVEMLKGA